MKIRRGLILSLATIAMLGFAQPASADDNSEIPPPCRLGDIEQGENPVVCEDPPEDVYWPQTFVVEAGGQATAIQGVVTSNVEACQAFARIDVTEPPRIGVPGKLRAVAWTECSRGIGEAAGIDHLWVKLIKNSVDPGFKSCDNTDDTLATYDCKSAEVEFASGDYFYVESMHRWQAVGGARWVAHNPTEYWANRNVCWVSYPSGSADPSYRTCRADGAMFQIP